MRDSIRLAKQIWEQPITYFILCGVVISLPALMTFCIVYIQYDSSLHKQIPNFPNDQRGYYQQTAAFMAKGFNGGYTTIQERTAPAQFSHFGPNGPLFPVTYGLIAKMLGDWKLYSSTLVNIHIFMLALTGFIVIVKPDKLQLLLLGATIATFYPVVFYWASHMQESLQQALGILFAALLYDVVCREKPLPVYYRFLLLLLLIYASLIRFTWSLLFLPFFVFSLDDFTTRRVLKAVTAAGLCAAAAFFIFRYLGAPFPNNTISKTLAADTLPDKLTVIRDNLNLNFDLIRGTVGNYPIVRQPFIQIIILLELSTIWLNKAKHDFKSPQAQEAMIHLLNIFPIFILTLLVYSFHFISGYRALTGHVFLSMCLLVAFRRTQVIAFMLIVNFLFLSDFLSAQKILMDLNFSRTYQAEAVRFAEQTQEWLYFDDRTDNSWCNTLLVSFRANTYILTYLEDGLGVSLVNLELQPFTQVRSKYVIVDPKIAVELQKITRLEYLISISVGDLFYNVDSGCPLARSP